MFTENSSRPRTVKEASFVLPKNDGILNDDICSVIVNNVKGSNLGMMIDPTKSFDNFVVGPSNNMAFAIAKEVSTTPGSVGKYPTVYVHSNSGLGKTHLLHAVANSIRKEKPELSVCLVTARDFMKDMIEAIQTNRRHEFQNKYCGQVDVLMIDDVHELSGKKSTQNEFFHVFNELYNRGKQLIFTSDKSPTKIDGIEERIKSRLQWGIVLEIGRPDFETRIAILRRKAEQLDLFLPEDIVNLLARNFKTNIRELEGVLTKLSAFVDIMGVEIDVEIVKSCLNIDDVFQVKITNENVLKGVADFYNVSRADIKSTVRGKKVSLARHVAMYLSYKLVKGTLKEAGLFYGRHHTSVIHASMKIKDKLMAGDDSLSRELFEIESRF